ncbi:MAG: hypothetical protein AAF066_04360 [Pseudomonadota bacterium]
MTMPKMPVFVFVFWSALCAFAGLIFAPYILASPPAEDHSAHLTHEHKEHSHAMLEVDPATAPQIAMKVMKDAMSGWNVLLQVENFRFAPDAVNGTNQPNEGHAHIYVNGEKQARVYGTAFHLADLPPGEHEISVSLNANDHSTLAIDGKPIEARVTVTQPQVQGMSHGN